MDLKALLNQALNSEWGQKGTQRAQSLTRNKSTLATFGAGALGGGLLGVLMGSKKSKKLGKSALKIGGAAALGALAYKVYNDWQVKQPASAPPAATFDEHNPRHELLILKAMIAAAKADGHVDEHEMAHINQAVQQLGADASVQTLIELELKKPLDPADIARLAQTPAQAAELYLASCLIVDEQSFMEKAYLSELAKQLRLDDALIAELHQQVREE
ncbi:tellurite resistance TerB family protein [Vibrio furnissii]|uniref:tellurite resistance TerB family protein n=1 Tax=Vibrio furnissii TaxID=29494 RepID=UPI0001B9269D|nr:tellurite resistance TerB family protein [Vibrio furnissii]EEX38821.1 hypothetical protein VFA_004376 [Vibrio furnissii CIP 102972]QDC92405.1 tellurite resistance TerB family protein [Vibrio furnissii]UON48959.1 tellurite resistance TerB family protein [Vibrio furnissii]SUP44330.1 putative Inner membrane protein [Vibrio furnissii]